VTSKRNKNELLRKPLGALPGPLGNLPTPFARPSTTDILAHARLLRRLYAEGRLGGEVMPEDANPGLPRDSATNYLYFTLPMALNYQRSAYALWASAREAYLDPQTTGIYDPAYVVSIDLETLRNQLTQHKVALQPIKHCQTWATLCHTFMEHFDGDVRGLFIHCNWHIPAILTYIQQIHKKAFPYLSGPKIANYWLHVISQYTDAPLTGIDTLSIAPDTHVIQATIKLGLLDEAILMRDGVLIQQAVNQVWRECLAGTELALIDLHTPLWLWSRGGFQVEWA
jgi:hypothetical protein